MLLVAIRAKNISPLHWLVVLGLTGRLANRYAMLLVAIRAKNVSLLHLLVVLGLTNRGANMACGVAGCDSGEKCFAPTLIGGVEADWLGCEQGARCLWFAIGVKNFGRTLGCALGGRAIKYGVHVGNRLTMRQPSAQGL